MIGVTIFAIVDIQLNLAHFRVLTFLETGPEFGRESEASCEVRLGGAKIKRDRWFFYP